jgi:DNA-binding response OmpR family regulator
MAKILIIEDRRENLVFIANNILKPMGYDIITARDGALGLQKALEESPDLIITDVQLPSMSGLQVLEQLREEGKNIPSIVMTFHGTEETAVRALRLGAVDYLIKPFSFEEMQDALDRAFKFGRSGPADDGQTQAKLETLEQEFAKTRALLSKREQQLRLLLKRTANSHKKPPESSSWEDEGARLNEALAKSKFALSKAENRVNAVEEAMVAHRDQLERYKQDAKKLADDLLGMADAVHKMSQEMEQQLDRLNVLTPVDESER